MFGRGEGLKIWRTGLDGRFATRCMAFKLNLEASQIRKEIFRKLFLHGALRARCCIPAERGGLNQMSDCRAHAMSTLSLRYLNPAFRFSRAHSTGKNIKRNNEREREREREKDENWLSRRMKLGKF
jgi:hypothetical protein